MRLRPRYDGLAERLRAPLGRRPEPAELALHAMAAARSLQVAQRVGIFGRLAHAPATEDELAHHLALRPEGTRLLLDTLCAGAILRQDRQGRYALTRRAAKWLSPTSASYVGAALTDSYYQWPWWAELDTLVRKGTAADAGEHDADDPYWLMHVLGRYQLARLTSAAVAEAVPLGRSARSVLDVGGAHGEHAMALCRRHPGLTATVVDRPGATRVGRDIVERAGLADRVLHVDVVAGSGGVLDLADADLGGPHDGALCFDVVHRLDAIGALALFRGIAAALRPGAPLAVLDRCADSGRRPDGHSAADLLLHLVSGTEAPSTGDVAGWLASAGFGPPRVRRLPQLPGRTLLVARRLELPAVDRRPDHAPTRGQSSSGTGVRSRR
jgi:hypothetical protein